MLRTSSPPRRQTIFSFFFIPFFFLQKLVSKMSSEMIDKARSFSFFRKFNCSSSICQVFSSWWSIFKVTSAEDSLVIGIADVASFPDALGNNDPAGGATSAALLLLDLSLSIGYTNCDVSVVFQHEEQHGRALFNVSLNASRKSRLKYA